MSRLDKKYAPSGDIVAREIEGELVIVPLVSGIGDIEDEIFTLNETGKDVWGRMDGTRTLHEIILELSKEYEAPVEEIQKDVIGLVAELEKRKMLIERK